MTAVTDLDPERIYVENVRSILGVPHLVAKAVCEIGVREGTLKRRYAYYCANNDHRVIAISDEPLPASKDLTCEVCELTGGRTDTFPVETLRFDVVYGFR